MRHPFKASESRLAFKYAAPTRSRITSTPASFVHRLTASTNSELSFATTTDSVRPNSFANFPRTRLVAYFDNFAGEFKSRNVLRITRRRGIAAQALQDVRPIQSRRVHAHAHAIRSRAWRIRNLAYFEALNAAEGNDC